MSTARQHNNRSGLENGVSSSISVQVKCGNQKSQKHTRECWRGQVGRPGKMGVSEKYDPGRNDSISFLLFEGMNTSRGQEIHNRFHKLQSKHPLMERINVHLLSIYNSVITHRSCSSRCEVHTCRKCSRCVNWLVCWVRSELDLRNSASWITGAKEKLWESPKVVGLSLICLKWGLVHIKARARVVVQHTHTYTTFLIRLCTSLFGDNWNGQITGGGMVEVSMEVSAWRVLACNQIPQRELVQGVCPLKPVCWPSDECIWGRGFGRLVDCADG